MAKKKIRKADEPLRIPMQFEDALRHILKAKPARQPVRKGAKKR